MKLKVKEFYASSNGDTWRLIDDPESGCAIVRHEANRSSGGQITDTDVESFLRQAGPGPEFAALKHLLQRE